MWLFLGIASGVVAGAAFVFDKLVLEKKVKNGDTVLIQGGNIQSAKIGSPTDLTGGIPDLDALFRAQLPSGISGTDVANTVFKVGDIQLLPVDSKAAVNATGILLSGTAATGGSGTTGFRVNINTKDVLSIDRNGKRIHIRDATPLSGGFSISF